MAAGGSGMDGGGEIGKWGSTWQREENGHSHEEGKMQDFFEE